MKRSALVAALSALGLVAALVAAIILRPGGGGDAEGASPHQHGSGVSAGAPAVPSRWSHLGGDNLPHRSAIEIQDRIDSASPGAVIVIEPGMYHGNLLVDRRVTLEADGHVLVEGDGAGSVIVVTGDGAAIRGLHVRHSAEGPVGGPAGISIEADDVLVEDVLVEDTYTGISVIAGRGIHLLGNAIRGREDAAVGGEEHATSETDAAAGGAGHATMSAGGHHQRGDGISLWNTKDAVVRDNVVESARDGIFLSFASDALIDRNLVVASRYAVHGMFATDLTLAENTFERNLSGAVLMYGGPALLLRNRIEDSSSASTGFGILLKDVAGCDAVENVLVRNRIGIQIDGPGGVQGESGIVVHGNTIALNQYGASLYPSASAAFYRNSFVENTVQVVAQGEGVGDQNVWSHEGAGNYWSDYAGYDLGGEGVGDVAHHEGGSLETLMVRAPVLQALAGGPAFGLLRAVEDRWTEHEAIVTDPLPLMEPHSPAVANEAGAGRGGAVLAVGGLLALALAAAAISALRRPTGVRRGG